MKTPLWAALQNGHEEAAQILANKGAQCTAEEIRLLGNNYTQFAGKRATQAAVQQQWQGAGQPIQGKVRPGQEQDSPSNEENGTGTKEQEKEEGKEEKEIRKKGGFVYSNHHHPRGGEGAEEIEMRR